MMAGRNENRHLAAAAPRWMGRELNHHVEAGGSIDAGVLRGTSTSRGGGEHRHYSEKGRRRGVRGVDRGARRRASTGSRGHHRRRKPVRRRSAGRRVGVGYLQLGMPRRSRLHQRGCRHARRAPSLPPGLTAIVTRSPGSGLSVTKKAVTAAPARPKTHDYRRFLVARSSGHRVCARAADTAGAPTRPSAARWR